MLPLERDNAKVEEDATKTAQASRADFAVKCSQSAHVVVPAVSVDRSIQDETVSSLKIQVQRP